MSHLIISTGNEEVDRQISGGLPFPSLLLIEGEHGNGKTSLSGLFIDGLLKAKKNVLLITESTIRSYLANMKSITFNFTFSFLQNKLTILPLQVYGMQWSKNNSKMILPVIQRYMTVNSPKNDCIVIDSMSLLLTGADDSSILEFFTLCKHLVNDGHTVILTLHPDSLNSDVSLRIKAACDGYMKLGSTTVAGKEVKTMNVVKLLGTEQQITNRFSYEVDPNFGIKIVPLSAA